MIPGMCCGTFGVGIRSGLYGWHEFVRNIGGRGLKQARKECANAVMALGNDVKSLVEQTSSRASSWEPPGKHFRHLTILCQNQPRQLPSVATSDTITVQSSTVQSAPPESRFSASSTTHLLESFGRCDKPRQRHSHRLHTSCASISSKMAGLRRC